MPVGLATSHGIGAGGGRFSARLRLRQKSPPVKTNSRGALRAATLAEAGCSLVRDSVDRRIIDEIRTGTAKFGETYKGGGKGIIDSQQAVGGWPDLRSRPAPADADHDGMPDEWERTHGLNPHDPTDGPRAANGSGYTNLEVYLNSLTPNPNAAL